jgi:hypothetical protein
MRGIWLFLLVLTGVAIGGATVGADQTPGPAILEHTDAFDKAYAASFYEFDACGDGVTGRTYRSALVQKLKQCPFSAEAKQRFQMRAAEQRRKSSQAMAKLIEDYGGLPIRLPGMTRTCREQIDSPDYRLVRSRIDDFSTGKVGPDAVVAQACDAAEITP